MSQTLLSHLEDSLCVRKDFIHFIVFLLGLIVALQPTYAGETSI